MDKILKKINLIFCGINIAATTACFKSGDILMGSVFAACGLTFLIVGWKE